MRYFLLLKRLLRKKSYILMLLMVPAMVLLLKESTGADTGVMTIGVCIQGTDESSVALEQDLQENPGAVDYRIYSSEKQLVNDVKNKTLTEGWLVPADLEQVVKDMASGQTPSEKVHVILREQGLTHLLGREILSSRVYPLVAKELYTNYVSMKVYGGSSTEAQLSKISNTFDSYGIDGNLFEMGYLNGDIESQDNILLMPLRGILAIWLLLCGIAASMYYIQDEKNGLFIWWDCRLTLLRDFGYYAVIFLMPTLIVIGAMAYGGIIVSPVREISTLLIYDFTIIMLSILLRKILKTVKNIEILTPALIIINAVLSPVFIDFKELRFIQKCCPTFHYLSSIHDFYYIRSLFIFAVLLWGLVVLLFELPVKVRKVLKTHLL